MMGTKKKIITIIIGVEVVIIAAVLIFLFYINSNSVKVSRQLELAQRYLLEEDYEQAIAVFNAIIDIDISKSEAYVGLAEAYSEMGDLENAIKILEKGSRRTDSDELEDLLKKYAKELEKTKPADEQMADAREVKDTSAGGLLQDILRRGDASSPSVPESDDGALDTAISDDINIADFAYSTGEITIWVPDSVCSLTQKRIQEFQDANPQYAGYIVSVEPMGEDDAESNMLTDVGYGADIYGFTQYQFDSLVASGALTPVTGEYATFVREQNDAGPVAAAAIGGTIYAFPIASDFGYFMYYDKSVITDPTSLDAIIADCEAAGKYFCMQINSGWYQPAFFFGAGCTLEYGTDEYGSITGCIIDYASEKGLAALKVMINLKDSYAFENESNAYNAVNYAAIIDGTWDANTVKQYFGDNYACAKLPKFRVDGREYQLGGFGGYKFIGVKPQTDANKLHVCMEIAEFLSNEETQLARYREVAWGPSNKAAQQSWEVQSDEALSALQAQLGVKEIIPQGQYPSGYWELSELLGDLILDGTFDYYSDYELMGVLEAFQRECESYVH